MGPISLPTGPAGIQKRWNEIKNAFTVAEAFSPKPQPTATLQGPTTNTGAKSIIFSIDRLFY